MSGGPDRTSTAALGRIPAAGALADAVAARAGVLEMTDRAAAAVLTPAEPGAWSHALRAALAARVAAQHRLADIAGRHATAAGDDPVAALADPKVNGAALGLGPVVAFTDRVAVAPREATADDIAALQAAGISDADIVRLTELNAFLAYQYRLVAGLRLLAEAAP